MKYIIIFLSIIFTSFCIPLKKNNSKNIYHLVIDAGSSGTRFCIYPIKRNNDCELQNIKENCYPIPAKDGLANLPEQEIYEVLNYGFKIVKEKTPRVDFVSLLGTGGFRKLSYEEQQKKWSLLDKYFKQNLSISYQLKFISGKEEAYYAWKSIAILYQSIEHITLETGGATVQISIGNQNNFESISLPIGLNQSYEKLISYKDFEPCKYGKILSKEKYDYCKNFVKTYIYQNEDLNIFLDQHKMHFYNNNTYTLGRPWMSIFNLVNQNPISFEDLKKAGIYYCSLTSQELVKKNIPENFSKQICYLFYYHHAQIDALKIQKIYRGTDSWTIGASIDEKTFPYCNSPN